MSTTELEPGEVAIKIEGSSSIMVGASTVEVLQGEANKRADKWLSEANEIWGDLDVTDIEQIKTMEFKISMVSSALSALKHLAPVYLDDEDGRD